MSGQRVYSEDICCARDPPRPNLSRKDLAMSTITTIKAGNAQASIDSMGAQLTSYIVDGKEYLWQADPAFWGKHAPILFPIVGSIRNNKATSAAGECNMARHGVARIHEHKLVGVSDDGSSATFELVSDDETRAAYPFDFKLNMIYSLSPEGALTTTFKVTNTGSIDLPFSVGGHPAFNVPVPGAGDETFEDYALKFTEAWTCTVPVIAEDGLMTFEGSYTAPDDSGTIALTHESFNQDAIVLTDVPGSTLKLEGTKSGHGIKIDFAGFKYIGVWSAANDAPFIALEPWTGHSTIDTEDDVFENKENITILAPGKIDERSFTVSAY